MKSIATELVNEYEKYRTSIIFSQVIINKMMKELKMRATQHYETCQEILNERKIMESQTGECNCDDSCFAMDLIEWCEEEIKILKDGGLI